jgi:hypothetical protein
MWLQPTLTRAAPFMTKLSIKLNETYYLLSKRPTTYETSEVTVWEQNPSCIILVNANIKGRHLRSVFISFSSLNAIHPNVILPSSYYPTLPFSRFPHQIIIQGGPG